jgi:hypothetical protein
MKRILLSDQPLGPPQIGLVAGELRLIVPDGQTPLHLVADGTPSGTLVGGSRYVGWLLENRAQGFLFDRTTRQSWYIYAQYGEPGSGQISWYARDLHQPMPDWADTLPLAGKVAAEHW